MAHHSDCEGCVFVLFCVLVTNFIYTVYLKGTVHIDQGLIFRIEVNVL